MSVTTKRVGTLALTTLMIFTILGIASVPVVHAESITTWTQSSQYPFNSEGTSCAISGDVMYCVAGYNWNTGLDVDNVYYSTLTSSGFSTWTATYQYPENIYIPSCATSGGYIYCVGGNDSDFVAYAELSGSGVVTGWDTSPSTYPVPVEGASCVTSNSFITCVGGSEFGVDGSVSKVYYAPVSSSGVGSWTETTDYACTSSCGDSGSTGIAINSETCFVTGTTTTYITCVGGEENGGAQVGVAYYNTLSSGAVGSTWTETTTYPVANAGTSGSCATSDGYVYCLTYDSDASYYSQVTNGALGTWSSSANYPEYVDTAQCAVFSGTIGCTSGDTSTTPYSYYSPVYTGSSSTSSSSTTTTTTSSSTTTTTTSITTTTTTSTTFAAPPPPLMDGNVIWSTSTYVGFEYIYPVSVAINGVPFSTTFFESLFAQYEPGPGSPFAGYYTGSFGAIAGCQPGSVITITATVNGVTQSASGLCPGAGDTSSIMMSFAS